MQQDMGHFDKGQVLGARSRAGHCSLEPHDPLVHHLMTPTLVSAVWYVGITCCLRIVMQLEQLGTHWFCFLQWAS